MGGGLLVRHDVGSGGITQPGRRRCLAAEFRNWHHPIPRLLAATPPEALLRHDIHSLDVPLPSYVSGRVALLGDAAHAITPDLGQGAGLALEDAVTLAGLAAHEPDLRSALAGYDRARRPRTQRLVRASALSGRIGQWSNPVAAFVRNGLTGLMPTSIYMRAVSDTFSWTPNAAWSATEAR